MPKSTLPDGQHVSNDPVSLKEIAIVRDYMFSRLGFPQKEIFNMAFTDVLPVHW